MAKGIITTWIDSDTVGVTGTKVYRDGLLLDTVAQGIQEYKDPNVVPDVEYEYVLQAVTANGESVGEVLGVNKAFYTIVETPVTDLTPIMTKFRVEEATPTHVHFDTPLGPITGLTTDGFVISGKNILSVEPTLNYFIVDTPFTFWYNNTIRLGENTDTSDVNPSLHNFTLSFIENKIPEPMNDPANYRYVTTAATGGGDGESEETAWTWLEADGLATAGMTVWVKAGNYGNINVELNRAGTDSEPIKFIGYKNTINDITSNYLNKTGDNFSSSEMPTIESGDLDDNLQMIVIYDVGTRYILRNIQLTNGGSGIIIGASGSQAGHCILDRFNVKTLGDTSERTAIKIGNTAKTGMPNMRVTNCVIVDGSLSNIYYKGEGNSLFYNNSLYNSRTSATHRADYMFNVNGSNNILKDNLAEYGAGNGGSTHGIGVRGDVVDTPNDYNLIVGNTATNIQESLYVRNDADYNVFKENTVLNNGNTSALDVGAFCIWSDSDYNIFENNITKDQQFIYYLYDNDEDGGTGTEVGIGNIFRNNIHDAGTYGAYLIYGSSGFAATFTDNYAYNNTFINYPNSIYNHNSATTIDNFVFKNNIFDTVFAGNGVPGLVFDYNTFWNSWTEGIGANDIHENPNLTDYVPDNEELYVDGYPNLYYDLDKKERTTPKSTIGAITLVSEQAGTEPPVTDIDYYVSFTEGLDSNDGLTEQTAWKTLYHIYEERASITPGKVVALKKGDVWSERLLLSSEMNGTLGNEIVITSYGTDPEKPKISQTESVINWVDQTNNIWRADVSGTTIYHVLKDDELQTNARFPIITSDFATEDNYSNINTVTDQTHLIVSDLSGFGTDALIGANVYILTSEWILEQGTITAYNTSNGAITVSGFTGTISVGEEIFINNNINLLATQDDWHYDNVNEDLYIYDTDPAGPTNITAITQTTDGCAANSGYVTLDGLEFSGLYGRGVTSESNTGVTIQNCSFKNIWNFAVNGYNSVDLVVINNTFDNSTTRDVTASGTSTGMIVERNTIRNSGLLSQLSYLGYNDGNNKCIVVQVDATIRNNDIENAAYSGIFTSNPAIIEENYIKSTCLAMQDGGAIYTTGTGAGVSGTQINNNICIANPSASDTWNSFGIYLDESSEIVTVGENTTTGFKRDIFLHKSKDNIITYNSMYKAKSLGFTTSEKATGFPVENNAINNNDIYLEVSGGYALNIYSETNSYAIGTLNNNNYWNPLSTDDVHVKTTEPRDEGLTLAEWVTLSGQDANSTSDLGTTVNDSQLVYNATSSQVVEALNGTWTDLSGNSYTDSITLEPWSGEILIQMSVEELYTEQSALSTVDETNTTGSWVAQWSDSTIESIDTTASNGLYSMKCGVANVAGGVRVVLNLADVMTVEVGKQYNISIDAEHISGDFTAFQTWSGWSDFVGQEVNGVGWQTYTFTVTASDTNPSIRLYLRFGGETIGTEEVNLDNLRISEV